MQKDYDENFPSLNIQLIGLNEANVGNEANNAAFCDGRDIPWLQDVDADGNGISDVWYDLWMVTYRDVIVLDANNEPVNVFNLTINNLAEPVAYDTLREVFIETAKTPPESIWQSPIEPLDVNRDEVIAPLDALLVINAIQDYPTGVLPAGGPGAALPDYVDVTGDGQVAPLDALLVINQLNFIASRPQAALSANESLRPQAETDVVRGLRFSTPTGGSTDQTRLSASRVDTVFEEGTTRIEPPLRPTIGADTGQDRSERLSRTAVIRSADSHQRADSELENPLHRPLGQTIQQFHVNE